jgi:hypothetical protein
MTSWQSCLNACKQSVVQIFLFSFHTTLHCKSAIACRSQPIMAETCIRFGEFGARVMIEEEEVPHYAMNIDPAKKEVSCWIASKEGKVRESSLSY